MKGMVPATTTIIKYTMPVIDPKRVRLFLAALIHYDLDIPTLIRYLGGNYTGEYRDLQETVQILKDSQCDPTVISDLEKIFRIGCPMKMNASSTKKNFRDFSAMGTMHLLNKT